MRKFCVYKHTTPSGKVYIGITSRKPKERWDSALTEICDFINEQR